MKILPSNISRLGGGAAAALVFAALASLPLALASPPGPSHWRRGSHILVWIDPARAPSGGDNLVERAMETWTEAAAGRFSLARAAARDAAAIRVHFFRDDFRYGVTSPRVDAGGDIVEAEVAVAADAPGDALTKRIVVYLTALHELGHALGLPHTDSFDDIMYLFRYPGDGARYFGRYRGQLGANGEVGISSRGLSPADVRALRELYDR